MRFDADVDPKLLVLRFNEAINGRDLDALMALVTEDHCFVDAAGARTAGRDAIERAWRGFFAAFADYRNHFSTLSSRGPVVHVLGHSTCSTSALEGPAIWRAVTRGARVAEWRVFADDEANRQSLGLRAGGVYLRPAALKVMADYHSFPLWHAGERAGDGDVDPATLPLSAETRAALLEWARAYDGTLVEDDPLASGFATPEDEARWLAWGRELRERLQVELGPGWCVGYAGSE